MQLECMFGESELFTDRSIKIKLMMLSSVMDIKERKKEKKNDSPFHSVLQISTQFSSLTRGQVISL